MLIAHMRAYLCLSKKQRWLWFDMVSDQKNERRYSVVSNDKHRSNQHCASFWKMAKLMIDFTFYSTIPRDVTSKHSAKLQIL